jgi:UDP-N-acetylglucosamine acyltransferase
MSHLIMLIAPTARVHPDAVIGEGCVIGEYCVIEQDVRLGAGCRLEPYVYIKRWTTLGEANEISASTVLGTDPLDKNFSGERSYLIIGNRNKIREHYTISRGTQPESVTRIGDGNYIMTAGHIAHNCTIGNNTIIVSGALVAGHAEIGDGVYLAANVGIHQFCKVGRLALIGAHTKVTVDVPPFFMYADFYVAPKGLNLVGLRRAGFTHQQVSALKSAYRLLYRSGLKLEEALTRIETEVPTEHTLDLVSFIRSSKRGFSRE